MPNAKYSTVPINTTTMPPGIPFIIGNEAAERFCYYGLSTILVVFMTEHLQGRNGFLDVMTAEQAKSWYHWFVCALYFMPLFGAILADAFWGKYRTVMVFSLVYCLGNVALALDNTRLGLSLGLILIALGSGGIKPCVAANVGDQFGPANQHLVAKVFGWFYFAVNFGSFFSTMLTPWLLNKYNAHVAFAVPGALMFLAAVIFWLGRYRFVHIPPAGRDLVREAFSLAGLKSVARLLPIYLLISVFWALWSQTGSAWVLQAKHLNQTWLGIEWLPSQVQAMNPILVLLFIPLFSYVVYPMAGRLVKLTPLRKISLGLFLTVPTFLIPAWLEFQIARGIHPTIAWQFINYVIISAAEVMVSVTALEFAYTQAPKKMKSLIMSIYYLAIALGNAITASINFFIQNPDGTSKLTGTNYFLFFAALMLMTAFSSIFVAINYRETTLPDLTRPNQTKPE